MKTCYICKEEKPYEEFAKQTKAKDGHLPYCRPCDRERKRQWREANKDRVREYFKEYTPRWKKANPEKTKLYERRTDLKRKYGITIEEYDAMLEAQGGVCAICGESEDVGRAMPVDHDHESGKPRAILCGPCNRGLGQFKDNIEVMEKAVEYLRRFSC